MKNFTKSNTVGFCRQYLFAKDFSKNIPVVIAFIHYVSAFSAACEKVIGINLFEKFG